MKFGFLPLLHRHRAERVNPAETRRDCVLADL